MNKSYNINKLLITLIVFLMVLFVGVGCGKNNEVLDSFQLAYQLNNKDLTATVVDYEGTKVTDLKVPSVFKSMDGKEYSVVAMDDGVFELNKVLKKITLPESITTYGKKIFKNCDNLEEVVINGKMNVIPENTFYACFNLKSVTFMNPVEKVEKSAFYSCSKLEKLDFFKDVNEIGESAF